MLENLTEQLFTWEFLGRGLIPSFLLLCTYHVVYFVLHRAQTVEDYWPRTWRYLSWFFYLFAVYQPIAVLFPEFTVGLKHLGKVFTSPLLGKEGSPSLLALLALLPVFIISSRLASVCVKLLEIYFEGSKKLTRRTNRSNVKALLSLSQYALILLFILFGINLVGINLSSLVVLLGGLGLGIGFGLQNIAGNFVSGVTLLVTGHIQYGDFIRTKGIFGSIERIGLLSTVLLTTEYENLIIPNQYLLNDVIENASYNNNRIVQLHLPIGVDYESDLNLVMKLLQEVLKKNPYNPSPELLRNFGADMGNGKKERRFDMSRGRKKVQEEPSAPQSDKPIDQSAVFIPGTGEYNDVWLKGFGASSVDFEVRLMIESIAAYRAATHWFHMEVWQQFKENGITIPFSQMDVHFPGEDKGPSVTGFGIS